MLPTLRVCAAATTARVHKPLIHFLGKRQWPSTPEPPHAHPAGPPEYKAHFAEFLRKFESSGTQSRSAIAQTSKGKSAAEDSDVYQEFWQAPPRLWNPRVKHISEEETEAVLSGGASLF